MGLGPDDPTARPPRLGPRAKPRGSQDSASPTAEERELLLTRLQQLEARWEERWNRREEIHRIEADGLREQLERARQELREVRRQSQVDDQELTADHEELARRVDSVRAGLVNQIRAEVAGQLQAVAALSGQAAGASAAVEQGRKTKGWSAAISTIVAGIVAGALMGGRASCEAPPATPSPTYQPRR